MKNLITTIILIGASTIAKAQLTTTASTIKPISIYNSINSTTDTTASVNNTIGLFLVPSTVAAVSPATFHMQQKESSYSTTSGQTLAGDLKERKKGISSNLASNSITTSAKGNQDHIIHSTSFNDARVTTKPYITAHL